MAPGGRRAYDWRPWTRPSPEATAEGAASSAAHRPIGRGRLHAAPLRGLFVLACVYTLSVAREFLLRSPAEASRQLYDVLHHCDALGLRSIVVIMPPDQPEWDAVRDRLLRATRPLASIAVIGQ